MLFLATAIAAICSLGAVLATAGGVSFDARFGERSAILFDAKLLLREDGRIRLSDRGLELADSVFAEFV